MFTVRDFVIVDGAVKLVNSFTSEYFPISIIFGYDEKNNAMLVVADHHDTGWTVVTHDTDNVVVALDLINIPKPADLSWAV